MIVTESVKGLTIGALCLVVMVTVYFFMRNKKSQPEVDKASGKTNSCPRHTLPVCSDAEVSEMEEALQRLGEAEDEKTSKTVGQCPANKGAEEAEGAERAEEAEGAEEAEEADSLEPEGTTSSRNCSMPDDQASKLVAELMKNAKLASNKNRKYYQRLLIEIYLRFTKLNSTLLSDKDIVKSKTFLKELKKVINKYEEESPSQYGGVATINEKDIAQVLNKSDKSICLVYPDLC